MPTIAPDSLAALVIIFVAALAGAFVKGVTTMGLALIAVPIIALILDVQTAILSLFLSKFLSDITMLYESKRGLAWRSSFRLGPFIVAGIIAIPGATFLLAKAAGPWLYVVLGVSILLFVAYQLRPKAFIINVKHEAGWGVAFGAAAGATQGLTGVGGPYTAMYLYSLGTATNEFVFLSSVIYLLLDFSQLGAILYLDLYDRTRLGYAVLTIVPVMLGTWLGIRVRSRLNAAAFKRALLVLLAISAASLLVRAAAVA